MRLIDADELIEKIKIPAAWDYNDARRKTFNEVLDYIKKMPTAYDVDAVIAKLEKERKTRDENGMCILASVDFLTTVGIVRNGGRNESN